MKQSVTAARRLATSFALASLAGGLIAGCGDDASTASSSSNELEGVDTSVFDGLSGSVHFYSTIGGTLAEVVEDTGFAEFTELSGVSVTSEFTDATMTKFLAAEEQGGDVPWSLVQFPTSGEMLRAVDLGYLQPLDTEVVPVENAREEFRSEYAVPVGTTNGVVVVWNTEKWPVSGEHPERIEDLYDTEAFPGTRCMLGWADSTLEQALYADGVAPADIYPIDVERALTKLDTIKDDSIFTYAPDEVIQNLLNGECDIGMVPQGRAFAAVTESDAPLAIAWPGAYISVGWMGVPTGAPNPDAGQAALAVWAGSRSANLELANESSYLNQLTLLSEDDYEADVRDWLPLADRDDVIVGDGEYWLENGAEVNERFSQWLGG